MVCDLIQKNLKMMAPQLEYHGVGVVVSALMRFIHPSEHIWNKYPNPLPSQHLENCTTICQEVKNVSQRDQMTNYHYCDVIDNHNSYRMHPLSIEETWMTMHWPNRVFVSSWQSPWWMSKMRRPTS